MLSASFQAKLAGSGAGSAGGKCGLGVFTAAGAGGASVGVGVFLVASAEAPWAPAGAAWSLLQTALNANANACISRVRLCGLTVAWRGMA